MGDQNLSSDVSKSPRILRPARGEPIANRPKLTAISLLRLGCVLFGAATALLAIVSFFVKLQIGPDPVGISLSLENGAIREQFQAYAGTPPVYYSVSPPAPIDFHSAILNLFSSRILNSGAGDYPLGLLFFLSTIAWLILSRFRPKEFGDAQCRACGYLLIGRANGPCPECGAPDDD